MASGKPDRRSFEALLRRAYHIPFVAESLVGTGPRGLAKEISDLVNSFAMIPIVELDIDDMVIRDIVVEQLWEMRELLLATNQEDILTISHDLRSTLDSFDVVTAFRKKRL